MEAQLTPNQQICVRFADLLPAGPVSRHRIILLICGSPERRAVI